MFAIAKIFGRVLSYEGWSKAAVLQLRARSVDRDLSKKQLSHHERGDQLQEEKGCELEA